MRRLVGPLFVALGLLNPGAAAAPETKLERKERRCLERAKTQTAIDRCFQRSSTIEARKLSSLLRELETVLEPETITTLRQTSSEWNRLVVAQCTWERQFYAEGSVAPSVFTTCVAEHTRARIKRLKIFLCEGAGATGPCDAAQAY